MIKTKKIDEDRQKGEENIETKHNIKKKFFKEQKKTQNEGHLMILGILCSFLFYTTTKGVVL